LLSFVMEPLGRSRLLFWLVDFVREFDWLLFWKEYTLVFVSTRPSL